LLRKSPLFLTGVFPEKSWRIPVYRACLRSLSLLRSFSVSPFPPKRNFRFLRFRRRQDWQSGRYVAPRCSNPKTFRRTPSPPSPLRVQFPTFLLISVSFSVPSAYTWLSERYRRPLGDSTTIFIPPAFFFTLRQIHKLFPSVP